MDRQSASFGKMYELPIFLDGDHRDMCKFPTQTDRGYVKVRKALQAMSSNVVCMREMSFAQEHVGTVDEMPPSYSERATNCKN